MDKIILGIESSCDETAIAIIKNDELIANVVSTQIATHMKYGGVFPEIASRLHIENIGVVLKEALETAKITMDDVTAIAVTAGPGLIGALHVGLQCAKTLALMYHKPLIPVHHLSGHIYANEYVNPLLSQFPTISVSALSTYIPTLLVDISTSIFLNTNIWFLGLYLTFLSFASTFELAS
jgi:N6-L-threonylcarbamoyladenine synthase